MLAYRSWSFGEVGELVAEVLTLLEIAWLASCRKVQKVGHQRNVLSSSPGVKSPGEEGRPRIYRV